MTPSGIPGFDVEFRQAGGTFLVAHGGNLDSLAKAQALLADPNPADVASQAFDDGVLSLHYLDTTDGSFPDPDPAFSPAIGWRDVGSSTLAATTKGHFNDHAADDEFAMRAEGLLYIPTAGDWNFTLGSDDGSSLTIDGTTLLQAPGDQAFRSQTAGGVHLAAGYHAVEVVWFQDHGVAGLRLSASGPGVAETLVGTGPLPVYQLVSTVTSPLADIHAVEGQSAPTSFSFVQGVPSAPGDYVATIQWGDSTSSIVTASGGGIVQNPDGSFTVQASHTYAEASGSPYAMSIAVSGPGGSTFISTATATVADAPLSDLSSAATLAATEGNDSGELVLATFSDANPFAPASDFAATIDWGGTLVGTPGASVRFVSSSATSSLWQVVGHATYAEAGTYPVSVTVHDIAGASLQTAAKTVHVADAPLSDLTSAVTFGATEGNDSGELVLATFSDANPFAPLSDFAATIDWGGTLVGKAAALVRKVSAGATSSLWQVVGHATYAEAGTYAVSVTVHDIDGASLSTSATRVRVADAPLTDATRPTTLKAVEGYDSGTLVLATFTDANPFAPLSDFTTMVDWGGTHFGNAAASVRKVSAGAASSTWQVVGRASYAEAGTYTVSVTVRDVEGATLRTSASRVRVSDAPLGNPFPLVPFSVNQDSSTGLRVLATFTDTDPFAPGSDFTPVVDWGGVTVGTPGVEVRLVGRSASGSTWEVMGEATYSYAGNYRVSVTVADHDGGTPITTATTVTVLPLPGQQLLTNPTVTSQASPPVASVASPGFTSPLVTGQTGGVFVVPASAVGGGSETVGVSAPAPEAPSQRAAFSIGGFQAQPGLLFGGGSARGQRSAAQNAPVSEDALVKFFAEASGKGGGAPGEEDDPDATPWRFPNISPLPEPEADETYLRQMLGVLIVWMLTTGALDR